MYLFYPVLPSLVVCFKRCSGLPYSLGQWPIVDPLDPNGGPWDDDRGRGKRAAPALSAALDRARTTPIQRGEFSAYGFPHVCHAVALRCRAEVAPLRTFGVSVSCDPSSTTTRALLDARQLDTLSHALALEQASGRDVGLGQRQRTPANMVFEQLREELQSQHIPTRAMASAR